MEFKGYRNYSYPKAKLNLIDSILEAFTSIMIISSGGSMGKEVSCILDGAWLELFRRILKSPEKR